MTTPNLNGIEVAQKVCVALDVHLERDALALVETLGPKLKIVKVGMELFFSCGPQIVEKLKARGLDVFLDLKLHDIPTTIFRTVSRLNALGADFLTIHASGGLAMLQAAKDGVMGANGSTRLLAVTALTSLDDEILSQDLGIRESVEQHVMRLSLLASAAAIDGVVCSASEVTRIKHISNRKLFAVTPGIRFPGEPSRDHARSLTPTEALKFGSDLLVIGRPVTQATHPRKTFETLLEVLERHETQFQTTACTGTSEHQSNLNC